jgi:hypothetical protein
MLIDIGMAHSPKDSAQAILFLLGMLFGCSFFHLALFGLTKDIISDLKFFQDKLYPKKDVVNSGE